MWRCHRQAAFQPHPALPLEEAFEGRFFVPSPRGRESKAPGSVSCLKKATLVSLEEGGFGWGQPLRLHMSVVEKG
jgi:hypothetical protein